MTRTMINVLLLLVLFCSIMSCTSEKISIEERNEILQKVYADLQSSNKAQIVKGLDIIVKYQTHEGLRKILVLWESNIDRKIENKIVSTLKRFEEFRYSDELMNDIFNKYYKVNLTSHEKEKLVRLLKATSANIADQLIGKISQ